MVVLIACVVVVVFCLVVKESLVEVSVLIFVLGVLIAVVFFGFPEVVVLGVFSSKKIIF